MKEPSDLQGAIIGIMVTILVLGTMVLVMQEVYKSEQECFASLDKAYPNLSCGYGEVLYCEYENKTYKVIGHFKTGEKDWCSLEGLK